MAEYLSQAKFAEVCGITRQAVSKAVKGERVHLTKGRVDTGHPTNVYFLESIRNRPPPRSLVTREDNRRAIARDQRKKAAAAGFQLPDVPAVGPLPDQPAAAETDPSNPSPDEPRRQLDFSDLDLNGAAGLYKNEVDVRKAMEQTRSIQLKNDEARGILIKRDLVRTFFSEWYNIETTEFLTLAEKLSPEIAALFGIDDRNAILEVQRYIQKEISKTLDHIEITKNNFLKSFQVGES
jgi:transcriptional regulator with XRE-family HTH domain